MSDRTFNAEIDAVLGRLRQTLIAKRHDYGPGNIPKFGEYGVLVRTSDKIERLVSLLGSGNQPKFESLDDTWLDVAGYAILALMLRANGADFAGLPVVQEEQDA